VLNRLWLGLFFVGFLTASYQYLLGDHVDYFTPMVQASFNMAKLAFEISMGLIGLMCLWLGLFRVAEEAGLIQRISVLMTPLFRRLMPELPAQHPAYGSVTMNLAANVLGLDNAATPLGLKAMKDLQSVNATPDTATNAQILFLVLNTSSVTLIPVSIFMYRMQLGSAEPTAVFIPILLATTASSLAGLIAVSMVQRIKLWDPVILGYFCGFSLVIGSLVSYLSGLSSEEMQTFSSLLGNFLLMLVVVVFLWSGVRKRLNVYDVFIEGAKEGFKVGVELIPYLVAMLVAIGIFRASGALDMLLNSVEWCVVFFNGDASFVSALPTALMKPFSGSGARALMLETMNNYGVDSFPGILSALVQGSTETTFYVLAVYFGVVGIRHPRHAVACALTADVVGVVCAIVLGYWYFG